VRSYRYGADRDSNEDTPKYIQALCYARAPHNHPDSNQYAYPLPFSPRYNINTGQVVSIDPLATGGTEDGLAYHTTPKNGSMAHLSPNEYYPDLQSSLRQDLKPLQVVQPEGPSFVVTDGNLVQWQKWSFRIGFNYREGTTIHNVRYDGRKLFYRLSVSEMTVPYGDPRNPYHRKQAFDLGDAGAGSCANNLSLGCDCLGAIKYFDGWLADDQGKPVKADKVICLHEQDNGVGWKHTNVRTGNAAVVRKRDLIVQSIITVGNYEYIFAYVFSQAGELDLETRATGILSTQLIDDGKTSPWGNVVSRGVLAANHQHLFSYRIDPMIDGQRNTVIQEDSVPVPQSEEENPPGNAWKIVKTPIATSSSADAAPFANRNFKIVNEKIINAVSSNPVGYKIVPPPSQLLLASATSVVRRRARFAEHHIWVTKYRDGDLWAGGKWTNQSLNEADGVHDMAQRKENVRHEDLVMWVTFGMTHNPRVEDFPVMPVEVQSVSLKPADFFAKNPALDVPPSSQRSNKSVLVQNPWPGVEQRVDADKECCNGVKAKL
jgi:primary-amine oxidase